jgi:hypothetical protein
LIDEATSDGWANWNRKPVPGEERYGEKPLLRLLELYVLWSIGELDEDSEQALIDDTPKIREWLSATGTWQQVVAAHMDCADDKPQEIRDFWLYCVDDAKKHQVILEPEQFAVAYVNERLWKDERNV